jgi:hypothetical protein
MMYLPSPEKIKIEGKNDFVSVHFYTELLPPQEDAPEIASLFQPTPLPALSSLLSRPVSVVAPYPFPGRHSFAFNDSPPTLSVISSIIILGQMNVP